jgi:hypothetical protein
MTTEETKLLSSQHSTWLVVFTSSQISVGTTANLCVIIYFLVSRQRKRIIASDKMILNLAISDFIALTTYLPWRTHHLMLRERSEHTRVYASLFVVCILSCCNPFLYFFGMENQRVEFVKSFRSWIRKYSNDEDGCSRQPNNNSNEMEDKVHIDRQI